MVLMYACMLLCSGGPLYAAAEACSAPKMQILTIADIALELLSTAAAKKVELLESLKAKDKTIQEQQSEITRLSCKQAFESDALSDHVKRLDALVLNGAQEIQRLQNELAGAYSLIRDKDTAIALQKARIQELQSKGGNESAQQSQACSDKSNVGVLSNKVQVFVEIDNEGHMFAAGNATS